MLNVYQTEKHNYTESVSHALCEEKQRDCRGLSNLSSHGPGVQTGREGHDNGTHTPENLNMFD